MFDSAQILELATTHAATLQALDKVRQELEREFDGLEEAILALMLSVASGEPLLLIGPPGTAKSAVIRRFCKLAGIDADKEGDGYFEYLLTPFTEPGELWGAYNPASLLQGKLERTDDNMMQHATVVFLDEVFKASSAILNSLLSFINERLFYDRGRRRPVKLECLFAATNELPESADLQAVVDRFVLRCHVDNAAAEVPKVTALLDKAWPLTYGPARTAETYPTLLKALGQLRADIASRATIFRSDPRVTPALAMLIQTAREHGLSRLSNRRLVKFMYVMLLHRIYDAARTNETAIDGLGGVRADELRLLYKYFLDVQSNEDAIAQMEHSVTALAAS